jgi:manganese-dependent ADP-ribose/CDP-alcohol diphosphatase
MRLLFSSVFATLLLLNMSAQSEKPIFSFGIIADVQYADYAPAGTRYYRSSTEKLKDALKTLKNDSVSFIINLGDLIDKDYVSFKHVTDIIESSQIETHHVAGNHDYSVENRYKKLLPVLTPTKKGYYSFLKDNFRFILLNGNEISTYSTGNKATIRKAQESLASMKKKGEINAVEWNGGFSPKQISWLKTELDKASNANEKVLLVCHFPVMPENVHNLLNYREVLAILENYQNVIAWFNGHNHAGNYGNFSKIHFVTFRGMVETESNNSYARVDVYKNKLLINGYGREKSQSLIY